MTLSDLAAKLDVSVSRLIKILRDAGMEVPGSEDDIDEGTEALLREAISDGGQPAVSPSPSEEQRSRIEESGLFPATNAEMTWEQITEIYRQTPKSARQASAMIGIIGMPGSGKSAYLYVLGRNAEEVSLGPWRIGPLSQEYDEFLTARHEQLDNWQKTNPDDVPLSFQLFTLSRRVGLWTQRVPVNSFDPSGELWRHALIPGYAKRARVTDYSAINHLRTLAAECAGFLVLLDTELAGHADLADLAEDRVLEWRILFDRLAALDSGKEGRTIRRPIAVVLNKADVFALGMDGREDEFGLGDLIQLRQDPTRRSEYGRLMGESLDHRMAAARQFVQKWFPRIYAQTDRMREAEFFAISCWGRPPQESTAGGVAVGKDIYPVGIEEPLGWLVERVQNQTKIARRWRWIRRGVAVLLALVLAATAVFYAAALGGGALARGDNLAAANTVIKAAKHNPYYRIMKFLGFAKAIRPYRDACAAIAAAHMREGDEYAGHKKLDQAFEAYEMAFNASRADGAEKISTLSDAASKAFETKLKLAEAARRTGDLDAEAEHCRDALRFSGQADQSVVESLYASLSEARQEAVGRLLANDQWDGGRDLVHRTLNELNELHAPQATVAEFRAEVFRAFATSAVGVVASLVQDNKPQQALQRVDTVTKTLLALDYPPRFVAELRVQAARAFSNEAKITARRLLRESEWNDAKLLAQLALDGLKTLDPSDTVASEFAGAICADFSGAATRDVETSLGREEWSEARQVLERAFEVLSMLSASPQSKQGLTKRAAELFCQYGCTACRKHLGLREITPANGAVSSISTILEDASLGLPATAISRFRVDVLTVYATRSTELAYTKDPTDHKLALTMLDQVPPMLLDTDGARQKRDAAKLNVLVSYGKLLASQSKITESRVRFNEALKLGAGGNASRSAVLAFLEAAEKAARERQFDDATEAVDAADEFGAGAEKQRIASMRGFVLRCNAAELLETGRVSEAQSKIRLALRAEPEDTTAKGLDEHAKKVSAMCFVPPGGLGARPRGFYIDKYEVSRKDYQAFLGELDRSGTPAYRHPDERAGDITRDPERRGLKIAEKSPDTNGPVVHVTWFDACAYAHSVGKRLPTEDEWERAVGSDEYPWGPTFDATRCNTREKGPFEAKGPDSALCSKDRATHRSEGRDNEDYVYALAGNVSEWTATVCLGPAGKRLAVIKGGNWLNNPDWAGRSHREVWSRDRAEDYVGFRCACDPVPKELLEAKR